MSLSKFAVVTGAALLLVVSSSAAPEKPDQWREQYQNSNLSYTALRDFDEAGMRIGDLLDRLEESGDLSEAGNAEIASFFEQLEQEYMARWFGDGSKYSPLSFSAPMGTSTNNNYDREFRNKTRSSTQTYSSDNNENSE